MAKDPSAQPVQKVILFFRSLLFSTGMVASTLLWSLPVVMSYPFPYRYRYRLARQWVCFNLWWLQLTCGIRCEVQGKENIPPGPAVILAKHQSTWETLMLTRLFPPQVWVMKRELLRIPLFGWALAVLKPIAIDRQASRTAIKQVLRQGTEHLQQGRWVVIFPEGTRIAPGVRRRYGPGGAMLAAHSGYPIVPVAHNAGEHWPRRGFIKRPGTIRLVVGPLINSENRTAHQLIALTEEWIEATMDHISTRRQATTR
ncbi:MAG: 1-acyl-sn-glycerol-3-phosphate acyltransferase [Pseudomonadota bacterium]|nr:1-acyl-sn-glycerol-3-phosphate acyltransferase [Pseudomonadota bacterium]